MRVATVPLSAAIAGTGAVCLAAVLTLVASRTPLGSPLFFAVAAALGAAYLAMLVRIWDERAGDRTAFALALLFALLFRLPLALSPVGPDSDMVRYLWDGRVQQRGYNPYAVLPSDPALAGTHTAESARMPSLRARTPYPPAAQLFFRLVVRVHDSTRAMKLALVACDLLTILVLWRWLAATGRSAWLTLAYAWNPLVILEVAHSGHVDALGALWIVAAAYWLARRRTALATVAFVLAVATKLLPIVLVPLFIGRVRVRDVAIGALLLMLLYLQFYDPGSPPLGALPNVVAHIRFNGPIFRAIAAATTAEVAAAVAILAGLSAAAVGRWRRPASDPAAWAWPMAVALVCAPVIYPWYLLYLTPFLWTRQTTPLLAWGFSSLATYVVWDLSRHGGRWNVPAAIQVFELAVPVAVAAALALARYRRGPAEGVEEGPVAPGSPS
jgi:alpha-1,6-mannosyltransferase